MLKNHSQVHTLSWPLSRLGEVIETIGQKSGLSSQSLEALTPPEKLAQVDVETLGRWIDAAASRLGLEAEPVESSYAEVEQLVRGAGPALLRLPNPSDADKPRFLALLKRRWGQVAILGPDLTVHRVQPEVVRAAFCYDIETPRLARIDRLLAEANVPPERRAQVAKTVLREQIGSARVGGGWLLRLSPGVNIWKQARHALLFHPVAVFFGAHIVQQLLRVLAWWVIGRGALQGHFDRAWLVAWALILLTAVPFQVLVSWGQSLLAIGAGGLFKQRLLYGTLQLESEEVRHQGAGQFLGRAMESEAVELLALGGGFMAMVAVVEMAIAAWVLSMGSGGWPHALLLLGWVVFTTLIGWRYFRHSQPWIETYRQMTNDLVERMVGHRTRLAQESHQYWHDEEDRVLARYLKLSHGLDRIGVQLGSFITRGWLVLGLAGIAYTFIIFPNSATQLAISLGGIILAFQALNSLMMGILSVIEAILAWKQVAPLFHAAARPTDKPSLDLELAGTTRSPATSAAVTEQSAEDNGSSVEAEDEKVVLVARDLAFRYREYGRPVLEDCNLQIQQGDRLLLEGPSGGGKSTLAALLAGLRKPESGLLLLWGLDWQTLGTAEWRRRVVAAPQFHENHVLTETFAFNLLMGRGWPPQAEDLLEAEEICRELGLGDVLDRMPSGFQQMVGESGWQLSHGEQSRLFIARALLQKADLMVFDESFAALDPENLQRALECVLNRASTLLVIAHP